MVEFSKKTIAERVVEAAYTGSEAKFADSDVSTVYEFTPEGLRDWLNIEGLIDNTEVIIEELDIINNNLRRISPKEFGAVGDGVTDDTAAVNLARDAAAAAGNCLWLNGYFRYVGEFLLDQPIVISGPGRDYCGLYVETDRNNYGVHVMSSNVHISDVELRAYIPLTIQNGQGGYGCSIAYGMEFYPAIYSDEGFLIEPEIIINNTLRRVLLSRAQGSGGAHAMAYLGACGGLNVEDVIMQGYSRTDGEHGNCILAHWAPVGTDFDKTPTDIVIEPFVLNREPNSFTYHPHNLYVRGLRARYTGRLIAVSAGYNIHITDFNIAGDPDLRLANGLLNLVTGDEGDDFACPEDKGRTHSNIVIENGTAWYMNGSSPNPAGTSLFDLPGTATSKYFNADGTLAEDDLTGPLTLYNPPSLLNGGSATTDISVPGVTTDMNHLATAWFSVSQPSGYTVTASVPSNGTIRATFTNNSGATSNLAEGYLNVAITKERYQMQPKFSGITVRNVRLHGIGNTENIFNLRNCDAHINIENVKVDGDVCIDGVLLSNARGKITFSDCILPGKVELTSANGVTFKDTKIKSSAIINVTVADTTNFERGQVVYGETTGVVGTVYEVVDSTTLRIRLHADTANWPFGTETIRTQNSTLAFDGETVSFTEGKIVRGVTSGARARIIDVTDAGTTGTLELAETTGGTFQNNETLIDENGGTALANGTASAIASSAASAVALYTSDYTVLIEGDTEDSYLGADLAEGDETMTMAARLLYDGGTGAFTVGQTVTQATSGATGVIVAISGSVASGTLFLANITGTFADNLALTDPITGSANANLVDGLTFGYTLDLKVGTPIKYSGGTVYVTHEANAGGANSTVHISPAPAAATASSVILMTANRESEDILFENCDISGGTRGVRVDNGNAIFIGGKIRDTLQYGLIAEENGYVTIKDTVFQNNGLTRAQISTGTGTRSIIAGADAWIGIDGAQFQNNTYDHTHVLIQSTTRGGYMRNCVFHDSPASARMSVSALTNGGVFSLHNNRDLGGTLYGENTGTQATGVTATEYSNGNMHQTILTFTNLALPAIAGGADLAVGKLLYTFPTGSFVIDSARMNVSITQTQGNINADTPDGGIGTALGAGVVATLDLAGAGAENIVTGQTFNNCTGTAENVIITSTPLIINTADAHTIYFNVADGWAAGGDTGALLNGTVTLNWRYMGA